jgi:hypothetical protein
LFELFLTARDSVPKTPEKRRGGHAPMLKKQSVAALETASNLDAGRVLHFRNSGSSKRWMTQDSSTTRLLHRA